MDKKSSKTTIPGNKKCIWWKKKVIRNNARKEKVELNKRLIFGGARATGSTGKTHKIIMKRGYKMAETGVQSASCT